MILPVGNVRARRISWDNDATCAKRTNIETDSSVQVGSTVPPLVRQCSLLARLACPPCYREVQKRVNRYRRDLDLLRNAILTLNSSQTLNSLREDKKLAGELDSLAKNLNSIQADLQSNVRALCLVSRRTFLCFSSDSGAGLISRNTSDYDQLVAQFGSNATDFETRFRTLEHELPKFVAQNDRIRDILQQSNETFSRETTDHLSTGLLDSLPVVLNVSFTFSAHQQTAAENRSGYSPYR